MRNELFFNSTQDGALKHTEEVLIEKLKNQLLNTYGDFVGEIAKEPDYIQEYIKQVYVSKDTTDIIEDFEQICSESGSEDAYDYISSNIISTFKELIGVSFDTNREMFSFTDIYNVYVIFVLSLKDTIKLSTKGYHALIGNTSNKITVETISNYILSDEFSSNDDFIKNAAFVSENELIKNIKIMIDDFLITIDNKKFVEFIYKFILETEF